MIHINILKAETPLKYINALGASDIDFYLCGSRLWGTASPTSDYDFVTQHHAETISFLKKTGFVFKSTWKVEDYKDAWTEEERNMALAKYNDGNTNAVYEASGVEVIIVKNIALRLLFQTYVIENNIVIGKGDAVLCRQINDQLRESIQEPEHRSIRTSNAFMPQF